MDVDFVQPVIAAFVSFQHAVPPSPVCRHISRVWRLRQAKGAQVLEAKERRYFFEKK
jgi:hypothetical protein